MNSTYNTPGQRRVNPCLRKTVERHVAGVILEPIELVPGKDETTDEILSLLKAMDIPVVLIDRDVVSPDGRRDYDLVGIDNFRSGYQLGELMIGAGARRNWFAAAPPET